MTTIGFLACETTLPGAEQRRVDAFEHDLMVAAIEPALTALGLKLRVVDWEAEPGAFDGLALVLLGSSWNYQDKPMAFLERLEWLAARGIAVCNPPALVRWNSRKTYLRELSEKGTATIPTRWVEDPATPDLVAAMREFDCDRLVVKRQIGAGAEGQLLVRQSELPSGNWRFGHPAMIQPFLPAIQDTGEYSLIFIDGEFSHALRKVAAKGDYRIQTLYGGSELDFTPTSEDIASARDVMAALPRPVPLYARIDMVRGDDGALLLMEAELIEPYLYPEQGPQLGERLAHAIAKKVRAMTAKQLNNRAIVRVSALDESEDIRSFLQGLVTNDVCSDLPVYAALLTAQGKAMFDFLVWEASDGAILLDCESRIADDLAKRLSLYRLRRKIEIARDDTLCVLWSNEMFEGSSEDPRLAQLGYRAIAPCADTEPGDAAYMAHRLALGVPEGSDELGDILWLETNAVELNGVSFEKGCYVGQENTARMNWRQKVNRRLVVVALDASNEKRRKAAYPDLGLAVDHLRVADLDPADLPEWQRSALSAT